MKPIIMDYGDYDPEWGVHRRDNARGIIFNDEHQLLLIFTGVHRYYSFPGGGIKFRETPPQTLMREVIEETGHYLVPESIKSYMHIISRYKDSGLKYGRIFESDTQYFKAKLGPSQEPTNMTKSEKKKKLTSTWVIPEFALETNIAVLEGRTLDERERRFLERETRALQAILDREGKTPPQEPIIFPTESHLI